MVCSHYNCMTNNRPTICGHYFTHSRSNITFLFSLEETATSAQVLWHKCDYSISHWAIIHWILMKCLFQTGRYPVTFLTWTSSNFIVSVVSSLITSKFFCLNKELQSTLTFRLTGDEKKWFVYLSKILNCCI